MKIIISNHSGVPIYEQIKEQMKASIIGGEVKAGEMLPSIRQLAKDLKVSVITTTRAYTDLEQEGFIASMQGKGSYVLPQNKELIRENALYKIEEHLSAAISAAKLAAIPKPEILAVFELLAQEEDYE